MVGHTLNEIKRGLSSQIYHNSSVYW